MREIRLGDVVLYGQPQSPEVTATTAAVGDRPASGLGRSRSQGCNSDKSRALQTAPAVADRPGQMVTVVRSRRGNGRGQRCQAGDRLGTEPRRVTGAVQARTPNAEV